MMFESLIKKVWCGVVLLFFCFQCVAQPLPMRVTLKRYNLSHGFSNMAVNQIVQDAFGFIWIATQDGLNRFDGNKVTVYATTSQESRKILGNDVKALELDFSTGLLWVGNSGGLNAINTQTGVVEQSISAGDTISGIVMPACKNLVLHHHHLWLGSFEGLFVLNLVTKNLTCFDNAKKGNPALNSLVDCMAKGADNHLWVAKPNTGVERYNLSSQTKTNTISLSTFGLSSEFGYNKFCAISNHTKGQLFITTSKNIFSLALNHNGYTIATVPVQNIDFTKEAIKGGSFGSDSAFWFYSTKHLYRYNTKTRFAQRVTSSAFTWPTVPTENIRTIFFANHKHLWIGEKNGLAVSALSNQFVSNYHISSNKLHILSRIYQILPHASGYYVCADDGLYLIDKATQNIIMVDSGRTYNYAGILPNGTLFVSNKMGTKAIKNQTLVAISSQYKELALLKNVELSYAVNLPDSQVAFSTQTLGNIFIWNCVQHTIKPLFDAQNTLPPTIKKVWADSAGMLWILCTNSFHKYHPTAKKLTNYFIRYKNKSNHRDIFMDFVEWNGAYWQVSYGSGIYKVNKSMQLEAIIDDKQGLKNVGLYKTLPVSKEQLAFTTNNGLFVLRQGTSLLEQFTTEDGLQTNQYEEGAGYAFDGTILAGGLNGFSAIDTAFFSQTTSQYPLWLSHSAVQYPTTTVANQLLGNYQLRVASNYEQIKIDLSYPSFLNQSKTDYEYQIVGYHTNWVALPKNTPITIVGLAAGKYSIVARSRQNSQHWSFSNTIELIILPYWYQTIWFKTLLALTFMGVLYAFYRYRLYQLKAEERLRTKIAADLHDDIGSTLTSVKLFTELGISTNSTAQLPQIKQGIQEASVGLRDIIWVMDSRNNNAAQLINRLQKFAAPLCQAAGIALQWQVEAPALEKLELPLALRRDLYLILKEFINNSIKYANATAITLVAHQQRQRLFVSIADNGQGFDYAAAKTMGNGINNMLMRAKNSGYKAQFSTAPGQGTTLILQP
ncbi:MAG: hypothetical protein EAY75_16585 [Bacteroidetes bacterium]|nr:MAG: hypothetical protein EAY75_16585 [Bacteroidota bacterium]